MLKPLIGVALLAATTSTFAADEYYIVRGPDKHCKIVEERPTTTTITVVGDTVYKTRSEAQSAIKRVCSTTTSPSTTDDDDND